MHLNRSTTDFLGVKSQKAPVHVKLMKFFHLILVAITTRISYLFLSLGFHAKPHPKSNLPWVGCKLIIKSTSRSNGREIALSRLSGLLRNGERDMIRNTDAQIASAALSSLKRRSKRLAEKEARSSWWFVRSCFILMRILLTSFFLSFLALCALIVRFKVQSREFQKIQRTDPNLKRLRKLCEISLRRRTRRTRLPRESWMISEVCCIVSKASLRPQ